MENINEPNWKDIAEEWRGIARSLLAENQEKDKEIDVLTRMLRCYIPELGNEKD